ncbi:MULTISPECIES: glutaredoxin-like protein NrdH [unclassified Granulicatella]|uniref:glutaredoxin-like protein NrdH n=1 Tax=unclassified Granulicatella TaxID=2630493 RepID=UPI0010744137|nr:MULTISPECIES: glutaredoxin-like protein NrdH [unclassified Granulicatella]MBF0780216.1 glutaredoxin-like protein NrdH [Granulicatella sp. 19428wC4_WM01]TFU95709.1 glutaredoxin-like protein NrdH [Granulicatella sp. WM01]
MAPVVVYSKPNCMQCNFTKKFLEERNIPFKVKDVMEDEVALEEVKALGFSSLPVVVIEGEEPFSGFRPDRLEAIA